MAGINRLGKGPAKPGTMRPQDPNKYKTMDIFSEGTEGDKDYARMVQDIEDTQQNHTGWLFGRGAFDKGDLLYLRDEEEKRRFAEQELRESELRSFAKMRQRVDTQQDMGSLGSEAQAAKGRDGRSQAQIVQSLIKIKPAAKVKLKGRQAGPESKRLKREEDGDWNAPDVKGEPEEVKPDKTDVGLAGLLGGYGSDSEEEFDRAATIKPEPAVKTESLPLPDIQVKREVKMEPRESQPGIVLSERGTEALEEEEVDYEDSGSEDS